MRLKQANDCADAPALGLFQQLYMATQPAHQALERSLNLLQKPISARRIERVLKKFLGFHRGWEPDFARSRTFAPVMLDRGRARFAAADLQALGVAREEIARVPVCQAAARLHRSDAITMGSVYVMEGSTLGGEVIARALRAEPWLPAQGLQYFSPPDRQARSDWIALKAWAEAHFPPARWDEVAQGARETFTLMTTWQSNP
jgi:heme oxygenase